MTNVFNCSSLGLLLSSPSCLSWVQGALPLHSSCPLFWVIVLGDLMRTHKSHTNPTTNPTLLAHGAVIPHHPAVPSHPTPFTTERTAPKAETSDMVLNIEDVDSC